MKHTSRSCLVFLSAMCIFALVATTIFASSLKGKIKKNVYYSPANNFSVPVPPGMGMRVNDGYDKSGTGAVSFHDDFGRQMGIHYMPVPAEVLPSLTSPDTREAALKGWLREGAMKTWFLPAIPKARVIHEEMDAFEGILALKAMVSLPEGSTTTVMDSRGQRRLDSYRELIIFPKGKYVYMLTTETVTGFMAALPDSQKEPGEDWAKFAEGTKPFYKTIVFTE